MSEALESGRLVFRGANLLDGVSPPRKGMTVVVEGGRIAQVEVDAAVETGPDDRVVDLAGRSLMPGMFSCHFHSSWEGLSPISAPATGLHAPPALMALTAGKNARLALEHGITATIGASVGYGIDASLKQAIEQGIVPGPRMLAGSHELCSTGDLPTGAMINWHMQLGNLGVVRTGDGASAFQPAFFSRSRPGSSRSVIPPAAIDHRCAIASPRTRRPPWGSRPPPMPTRPEPRPHLPCSLGEARDPGPFCRPVAVGQSPRSGAFGRS